ncbi:E3 ubiquitin-protein ligase CHFR [Linum perenne]
MFIGEGNPGAIPTAAAENPRPTPNDDDASPNKKPATKRDFIISVASNISSQPLTNPDPNVWGVLTAISNNARKRPQGMNMLLTGDEHCIGRLVDDKRFRIESNAVSGNHCKIFRKRVSGEDLDAVFLKDTSTNGTYLNWEKLTKRGAEVKMQHGDIVSFAAAPQHDLAFAFVYREVQNSVSGLDSANGKRKAEEVLGENKRMKGLGIGGPDGPISLDDFKSLQRSNVELRKQVEGHVLTIDSLQKELRATIERQENEMKEVTESAAKPYIDQLQKLQHMLDLERNERSEVSKTSADRKRSLEELNERLLASRQSCIEANEIMKSQKASIGELEAQMEEERDQRKEERLKAAADLKVAVQKVQSEAQEEIKKLTDAGACREKELEEEINKLQEREKKWCSQVETLRPKLEEARQKSVLSDNKIRQLEAQISEEQVASANGRKRVEELEQEMRRLRKELDSEKQAAREEAWAKVSALELEINSAVHDLEFERRRLKGARERIMLRETQLRAFYSTTEEISSLFAKQQQQLKAMQKTLEDEENYENGSLDIDLNITNGPTDDMVVAGKQSSYRAGLKPGFATSAGGSNRNQLTTSNDEGSATEKHECDHRSQGDDQNTQGEEFTSAACEVRGGGFGSNIDIDTAPALDGGAIDTEQVVESESPLLNAGRSFDVNKFGSLAGDTMQLDEDAEVQETDERVGTIPEDAEEKPREIDNTELGGTMRTADLIASEVAGSWAQSTAPSVEGENGSQQSRCIGLRDSVSRVAESQTTISSNTAVTKHSREYQALSEMIGIVAPDLKEQFGGSVNDDSDMEKEERVEASSNSDTECCSDTENIHGDNSKDGGGAAAVSDSETEGSDVAAVKGDGKLDSDAMDEDDETQVDSVS